MITTLTPMSSSSGQEIDAASKHGNIVSIKITQVVSQHPRSISKVFGLDQAGRLTRATSAELTSGRISTKEVANLLAFGDVLVQQQPNQCLIYGVAPNEATELITKEAWLQAGRPAHQIPRTKEQFSWPEGPAIAMLDYDAPKDGAEALSKEALLAAMLEACPELLGYQMLWWPSTSSCLYLGERCLTGVKGQRIYLALASGAEVERFGETLNLRLWAAGHGHYEVSQSGQALERSLFDVSVWQTNRIDFAAGAQCHDGVEQRRGVPVLLQDGLELFDSQQRLPEPDPSTHERALENKVHAKAAVARKAGEARERWTYDRVHELRQRDPQRDEFAARNLAVRAIEQRELVGDWEVVVLRADKEVLVSVASLLANPALYQGAKTLDPLEPDYDGRRPVGKLFLEGTYPNLFSFAHGGTNYRLLNNPVRIEVAKGKFNDAVDAALKVLRGMPSIFEFGDQVVAVVDDARTVAINDLSLRYQLGAVCTFFSRKGDSTKATEIDPPIDICRTILSVHGKRKLKVLTAVISAPTLRPDGTVIGDLGYDTATGILFDTKETIYPVPLEPTKVQARAALQTLMEPFKDFPFVDPLARSVHLAALLTAAVRPVLPTAPAFAYDAPARGSGKTLLSSCVAVLASGGTPRIWPHVSAHEVEEIRKRFFTMLLEGTRAIVWDNVIGDFDSAPMAGMLTSPEVSDRILSTSGSKTVPNRALLIFNGNNFVPVGDMARRVLVCRIDPGTEAPHTRSFAVNPQEVCAHRRQEMVSAALTLIRLYIASGAAKEGDTGSFSAWDSWVRQTVIHVSRTISPEV